MRVFGNLFFPIYPICISCCRTASQNLLIPKERKVKLLLNKLFFSRYGWVSAKHIA